MMLREVKEAVGVIWRAWHSLARRQAFVKEVPSFLSCNLGQEHSEDCRIQQFLSGVLGNIHDTIHFRLIRDSARCIEPNNLEQA